MEKKPNLGRRDFLKKTAVGAAGLTAGMSLLKPAKAMGAWTTGMAINPNISNLRVVCMYDPKMITNANLTSFSLASYVAATDKTVISNDMDQMAMSLAQKTTADAAWNAIFQKPTAKTWAQVKVAIKLNTCSSVNFPRVAVVGKICQVLTGFGVPAANISIFDTTCNTGIGAYSNYFSATDTTKFPGVQTTSLGGTTSAPVPNLGNVSCVTNIANGTIDILVNIGVNKGHMTSGGDGNTGGCTLCLKNHFGTFSPHHSTSTPTTGDAACYYSMSDAIIGGTPPRQQLCIVDSLWADNTMSPSNQPNSVPARLVMGTFAGAVDYLTCLNIRKPSNIVNAAQMDWTQINRFLTNFGYTTTDAALTWVALTPGTSVLPGQAAGQKPPHALEIRLTGRNSGSAITKFGLPNETTGDVDIQIFDIRGRSVRKMSAQLQGNRTSISWDGKNEHGNSVGTGIYEVRVSAGHYVDRGKMIVE